MLNRIKGIIYDFCTFLAKNRILNKTNKALILRVDEIGDYLLWRKFIDNLIQSNKLATYEIHFIGNQSWKSLFDLEYNNTFEKAFWLDKTKFKRNMIYRYFFLRKVALENYQIVINPTYSRAKRVDDSIVKAASASLNFGFSRNNENYFSYERTSDKNLYHQLFKLNNDSKFEFSRNKEFTEWFCDKRITVNAINFKNENFPDPNIDSNLYKYFVVFPGSRSSSRIWSTDNFIEVSNYLYKKYNLTAIVCGGKGDIVYSENFIQNYQHPLKDMTCKTSLPELLFILKNAACLISVDTGSIHLAASVDCLTLGIFNGSQYGRFSPYPIEISSNVISFYPFKVSKDIEVNGITLKYELVSNISYNEVTPASIIDYLKKNPINKNI